MNTFFLSPPHMHTMKLYATLTHNVPFKKCRQPYEGKLTLVESPKFTNLTCKSKHHWTLQLKSHPKKIQVRMKFSVWKLEVNTFSAFTAIQHKTSGLRKQQKASAQSEPRKKVFGGVKTLGKAPSNSKELNSATSVLPARPGTDSAHDISALWVPNNSMQFVSGFSSARIEFGIVTLSLLLEDTCSMRFLLQVDTRYEGLAWNWNAGHWTKSSADYCSLRTAYNRRINECETSTSKLPPAQIMLKPRIPYSMLPPNATLLQHASVSIKDCITWSNINMTIISHTSHSPQWGSAPVAYISPFFFSLL